MRKLPLLIFLAIFSLLSCGPTPSKESKRVVSVTIEPYRYFVESIAKDKYEVNTLVPAGSNPETYEPSAQQMVSLSKSDIYIKVGSIGFERSWMKKLQSNAPKTKFVDSSEGISYIKDQHGDEDPHTWMSCKNAKVIATNICRALIQVDAKDSAFFKKNLESLLTSINILDINIKAKLNSKHKSFLVYHPILTYFANDYGLKQISVEREGREPSATDLKSIIAEAKKAHVGAFLIQQEFTNRNVEIVTKSTGAKKVVINPLGSNWELEMLNITNLLK